MKHFFWSKCFFCALLIVTPFALSAQITKAVGGDYITLMNIPENQIAAQANLYIGQGYMPVFVDAMYFEGKPPAGSSRAANTGIIATMILKKKPNSRMQVQLAQYNSSNNFVAQYAATKAQGWFIINQDAYLGTDNKEHYLAIWVKGNTADWGIVVDAGPVLHQSNFDQLSGLGYKMINRAYHRQPAIGNPAEVNGAVHATSLYIKQSNAISSRSNLPYHEYAKLCMDMKAQGVVLTYLDIHDAGYSPIFTKNPGFTPFSAFPGHKQSSATVKQVIEQKSLEGYYPLFVICDSNKQEHTNPQYAVWLVKAK